MRSPHVAYAIQFARETADLRNAERTPAELAELDQHRAGMLEHFEEEIGISLDDPVAREGVIVGLALAVSCLLKGHEHTGDAANGHGPIMATLAAIADLDEEAPAPVPAEEG